MTSRTSYRTTLLASLLAGAAPLTLPAQASSGSAELQDFFGAFNNLITTTGTLTPQQINQAYQSFYSSRSAPDWGHITPGEFSEFANASGLREFSQRAGQFGFSLPGLKVTDDGAAAALEYLKQGKYYEALRAALESAGTGMEAFLKLAREVNQVWSATYAITTASPVAPGVQVMQLLMRQSVLALATPPEPRTVGVARVKRVGLLGQKTAAAAEAFYSSSTLTDSDDHVDSYGLNLQGVVGDRLQLRLTAPLARTTVRGAEQHSYGADVALRYAPVDWFAAGVHGNFLGFEGDFSHDHLWTGGPFVGYSYRLNPTYVFSVGGMVDYVAPRQGADTWVGAFGANLGLNLRETLAVNLYYIHFRDFDAPVLSDEDWHDLGAEMATTFGAGGLFRLGAKTTFGYGLFDTTWQVYGSVGWTF